MSTGSVSGIESIVESSPSSSIYTFAPTNKPIPSVIFRPLGLFGHFETLTLGQSESSVVLRK